MVAVVLMEPGGAGSDRGGLRPGWEEGTFMTSVDERLVVAKSRAHTRFVEDLTAALKETEPSKSAIEEALKDQIGNGKRLLEMGEAACYLASVGRLQSETRDQMAWALTVGVKAFRDLREMVADWTRRHDGLSLEGEQALGPLVAEMDSLRTELASQTTQGTNGEHAAFPQVGTAEWGKMNQRRAELIRKNLRGELSEAEREEYETLQCRSLLAVDAAFPLQGRAKAPVDHPEASGG
jgi:hypothetical protein